jgi:hypothetical protein
MCMRTRECESRRYPARHALRWLGWLQALALSGTVQPVSAWVYPEHRDIAVIAVETLDAERREAFDQLWHLARQTQEQRLCELGADPAQGIAPSCIDWAALSAVAGDHSCSSQLMTATVLESQWILQVADVAAHLKVDLTAVSIGPLPEELPGTSELISDLRRRVESEKVRALRINALRKADLRLQRADAAYVGRARHNAAHFLLPRSHTTMSLQEYAQLTLQMGSRINALGVYSWYHLSALQKATRLARDGISGDQRVALARAMLFDEAFALHFLEDAFAAGHIAGSWGDTAERQGTHDYYNEAGLEVFLWSGGSTSIVVMGDAHMRTEDAQRTAMVVRNSLEQLLDTAAGRARGTEFPSTPTAPLLPNAFDVCGNERLIERPDIYQEPDWYQHAEVTYLTEVLAQTPIPELGPGLGAMPRFRSEVGLFLGLAGSVDGRWLDGGFTSSGSQGFVAGVDLDARVGLGLAGVLSEAGDGLVFLSIGVRGDTTSTHDVSGISSATSGGNSAAAVPSRTGISTRLRMPFYLFPGDLLLLSPLYLIAPERYQSMAVTAANGGLIPWQSGVATSVGRFQFVLGREIGVVFYGAGSEDRVLAPGMAGGPARLVTYKSTALDLPIIEYRPFRSFASRQSSRLLFQFFTTLDMPHSASVVSPPGAPGVDLHDIWSVGVRLVFDWRYYP